MGRIGFDTAQAPRAIHLIDELSHVEAVGVMTHFANADRPDGGDYTRDQIGAFAAIRRSLEAHGPHIPLWHAANSAGALFFAGGRFNGVRPGIALYGGMRSEDEPPGGALRQALAFKTRIAYLRPVAAGAKLGYGSTAVLHRPSRIAVLPVGYADGYPLQFGNRGEVLVRGRRAPVVGQVCMDMTLVDVTDIYDAGEGDEVVLYGRQGGEALRIVDLADKLGVVPYLLFTQIGRRVPRVYKHAATDGA
jgi:alanine racemase